MEQARARRPTTHGVRVYYQNNSFYASVGAQSRKLAQILCRRIAGCGLTNGGPRTRHSDNKSRRDPSGKKGDYYGVLFYNKTYKIPAVIVEHAFMSNKGDAEKLRSEAFLKRLGQADAAGIAQYLGLKRTGKYITGWHRSSGKIYNYDSYGYKRTGWQVINNKKYYFSVKDGHMLTAWQTIGNKKYYFSVKDGHMLTGRQKIGNRTYTFTGNGVLKK